MDHNILNFWSILYKPEMDIRENGAPRVNEPAAGCGTCRAHTIDRNI